MAPHSRGRAKGPGFWIGMALRGLGIQREPSQQGPPGLGRRQVPGINIYFLTSWCREAKLGCEATFSPDLNLCHLDSCLAGGKRL